MLLIIFAVANNYLQTYILNCQKQYLNLLFRRNVCNFRLNLFVILMFPVFVLCRITANRVYQRQQAIKCEADVIFLSKSQQYEQIDTNNATAGGIC